MNSVLIFLSVCCMQNKVAEKIISQDNIENAKSYALNAKCLWKLNIFLIVVNFEESGFE